MSIDERDGTYPSGVASDDAAAQVRAVADAAAEAVAVIEHHRSELRAAVAELTALQRDLRNEVRALAEQVGAVSAELDLPAVDAEPVTRRRLRRR
ncbi:MAG: hypothetical protein ACKO04_02630 [Actinomycetes bacterium]